MPQEYEEMFGKYQHSLDSKGRLFVPSKLRAALGDTFYVVVGMEAYLTVYPTAKWREFLEKCNALPASKAPSVRYLLANAAIPGTEVAHDHLFRGIEGRIVCAVVIVLAGRDAEQQQRQQDTDVVSIL